MILTDAQVVKLAHAGFLMVHQVGALSDFEAETLGFVGARFGRFKRGADVTSHEWEVVDRAIDAMEAAQQAEDVARARFLARTRAA